MAKSGRTTLTGYIIANREWEPETKLAMGGRTFGRTTMEAWMRHLSPAQSMHQDRSIYIQRWSEKGYGPHRVTLTLEDA